MLTVLSTINPTTANIQAYGKFTAMLKAQRKHLQNTKNVPKFTAADGLTDAVWNSLQYVFKKFFLNKFPPLNSFVNWNIPYKNIGLRRQPDIFIC